MMSAIATESKARTHLSHPSPALHKPGLAVPPSNPSTQEAEAGDEAV